MHIVSDRRRRTTSSASLAVEGLPKEGWISLVGKGSGFDDCPLCRELASQSETNDGCEAIVGVNLERLPELTRSGWLDDLIALVGPDATVQLMGRELEGKPVEVISMAAFLARIGYE